MCVLITMHKAIADIISCFEHELDMAFASDKMFVISTDSDLTKRAIALLGKYGGDFKRGVLRLGVPIAAISTLSSGPQKARVDKAMLRTPRIYNVSRALPDGNAGRLFFAGTLPSANGCPMSLAFGVLG